MSHDTIELQRFVQECVEAGGEPDAQAAVKDVLARAVRDPGAMLRAVGEPERADLQVFHRAANLTIFAATWTPRMNLSPHDHLMWAVIGLYTGREDNLLWQRTPRGLEARGVEALFAGDVLALAGDAIHSVTNPLERFTGGIHIYGGDFFDMPRSLWDPETLEEQPSDGDRVRELFARENARYRLQSDRGGGAADV